MTRKLLGLIAFVATGLGLMVSTVLKDMNLLNTTFLLLVGCFFIISVFEHFNEIND